MDISSYIEGELYILVPVLYGLGAMIKKSSLNDKWIPLILGGVGIILATAFKFTVYLPVDMSSCLMVLYAGITQGVLCASASVYTNNILKQMKKDI